VKAKNYTTLISIETAYNSRPARDELVDGHEGISHAELRYKGESGPERCDNYSLRNQQEELGLVHLYHANVNYYPFFQLILINHCYCCSHMIIPFLIFNGICAGTFVYNLASQPQKTLDVTLIVLSIISVELFYILSCHFCSCPGYRKDAVSRLHI